MRRTVALLKATVAALRSRVEELTGELRGLRDLIHEHFGTVDLDQLRETFEDQSLKLGRASKNERARAAAEQEVQRLQGVLYEYGAHDIECDIDGEEDIPCSCGFAEALCATPDTPPTKPFDYDDGSEAGGIGGVDRGGAPRIAHP